MAVGNLIEPEARRAFTFKSIGFGLLGVVLIDTFAQFSDTQLRQAMMVGNHFPIGGYCYILAVVLLWNPLVARLVPRLQLSTGELAVVLGMTLTACWPPTSGFYRYFHRLIILPWAYLPDELTWQEYGLLDYLPRKLFPLGGEVDDTVYRGFMQGLAKGNNPIPWWVSDPASKEQGLLQVLQPWVSPMLYWGPLLVFYVVCILAMALIVHRQWVRHEQLSYPLATISTALIEREPGRATSSLFRNRLFWWGVAPVMFIYGMRLAHLWYPSYVPDIVLHWNVSSGFFDVLPMARKFGDYHLASGTLYFTIIGVAYFVSAEIGMTMGLSQILLFCVAYQFLLSTGRPLGGDNLTLSRAGAYVGYAAILLYTGRNYYWLVLTKALGFGKSQAHQREPVLACRLLFLGFGGFYGMIVLGMGLDWLIALLFSLLLMLTFLVFTRIVCETGIPFLHTHWLPGLVLGKLLGYAAVGPGPLMFTYYLGCILALDMRETLMPYISTSLKVADDAHVKRTRMIPVLFGAAIVALVVGFFATSYGMYNYSGSQDWWAFRFSPRLPFDGAVKGVAFIHRTGQLEEAVAATGLAKLALIHVDKEAAAYFMIGAMAVIACSFLRFRFSWWHLHPVLFLVWGTYGMSEVFWSFLIGWMVKALVVRFGGGRVYQNLKPLFIGFIVGELASGGLSITIGFVYYFWTGLQPHRFVILPV